MFEMSANSGYFFQNVFFKTFIFMIIKKVYFDRDLFYNKKKIIYFFPVNEMKEIY